ncbi:MAG TPA: dihydroneopterin aldolase [Rhizomicrobium sp.]|jgi:dihydroneopterin aldolase
MTALHPLHAPDAKAGVRHIFIRNLEMLAHIGIHGHEQLKQQPIRINVDLLVEDAVPLEDRLERVVDYEALTLRIRALVGRGHINLAETLAEDIAAACLEDPRVTQARVRVEKLHAVAGAESAGVEVARISPSR